MLTPPIPYLMVNHISNGYSFLSCSLIKASLCHYYKKNTRTVFHMYGHSLCRDNDDEASVFDAVSKLNEVKGMRGLGRYFKQVAQSARTGGQDDFLGSVNIPIREIPSTGSEQWYKLEGKIKRSSPFLGLLYLQK